MFANLKELLRRLFPRRAFPRGERVRHLVHVKLGPNYPREKGTDHGFSQLLSWGLARRLRMVHYHTKLHDDDKTVLAVSAEFIQE